MYVWKYECMWIKTFLNYIKTSCYKNILQQKCVRKAKHGFPATRWQEFFSGISCIVMEDIPDYSIIF